MDTGATFHFHIMARYIFALLFRETVSFLSPRPPSTNDDAFGYKTLSLCNHHLFTHYYWITILIVDWVTKSPFKKLPASFLCESARRIRISPLPLHTKLILLHWGLKDWDRSSLFPISFSLDLSFLIISTSHKLNDYAYSAPKKTQQRSPKIYVFNPRSIRPIRSTRLVSLSQEK